MKKKRIQKHLRLALKRLKRTNTAHLSTELSAIRESTLQNLETYIEQAEFPLNETSFKRHPIFKDSYGNYCAMGYLLHMDGRNEIIDEIQANNNLVYVDDITQFKYLNAFAALGLGKEEAAQIQPNYGYYPNPPADETLAAVQIITLFLFALFQFFALLVVKELNSTRKQKIYLYLTITFAASLVTLIGITLMKLLL